jgi:hypothetical protein
MFEWCLSGVCSSDVKDRTIRIRANSLLVFARFNKITTSLLLHSMQRFYMLLQYTKFLHKSSQILERPFEMITVPPAAGIRRS